jgi:ketosteroid isomerase-like protein
MTTIRLDSATEAALVDTALDYFEGWFDGDAARMERALHPRLVKRRPEGDALDETTAAEMIDATRQGVGRTHDVADRSIEVEVVDVHRDVASVVVRSAVYHEYLQLARTGDGWKIANTLWVRT